MGKTLNDFDPEALDPILRWSWPRNVPELENAIEHAVSDGHDGLVRLPHLPASITGTAITGGGTVQIPNEGIDFELKVEQMEKEYPQAALQSAGGVRARAAAEHVLPLLPALRQEIPDLKRLPNACYSLLLPSKNSPTDVSA
jgi:two-component system response regulator PilR (NtrC family)